MLLLLGELRVFKNAVLKCLHGGTRIIGRISLISMWLAGESALLACIAWVGVFIAFCVGPSGCEILLIWMDLIVMRVPFLPSSIKKGDITSFVHEPSIESPFALIENMLWLEDWEIANLLTALIILDERYFFAFSDATRSGGRYFSLHALVVCWRSHVRGTNHWERSKLLGCRSWVSVTRFAEFFRQGNAWLDSL